MKPLGDWRDPRFRFEMPGNVIQKERDQGSGGITGFSPYQKRFCETCQTHKPKGEGPMFKGWKCDECKSAGGAT